MQICGYIPVRRWWPSRPPVDSSCNLEKGGISTKDRKKAEEIAANRVQLVAPLLVDGLDAAKLMEIQRQICAQSGLSERTLRRYRAQYREGGFDGLKPKGKKQKRLDEPIPEPLLEQAILLRREVPNRSIRQLIEILEWEEKARPGEIKRSTLQDKLAERGYSTRQMRIYADTGVAARRFQKLHRNKLWYGDIKYGPYLPIAADGGKKQVYLVAMLDDATRLVTHAAFYPTMDQIIVEDCFRQAVQKYGAPESVFFDNGKQYRTKLMKRACSKLGIRLLFARPYAPESKGKLERFNQVVDSFLGEAALEKPQTLRRLNELFWVWLSECYQNKPHSALGKDVTPEAAFRDDSKALRFVTADLLANAFLHVETRKVDKSGCISFMNRKYEVGVKFLGNTVDVIYDPADISEITVEYEGYEPWKARPLIIGTNAGGRPKLPEHLGQVPADSSRLLQVAEQKHGKRQTQQAPAVSYRHTVKEDRSDV